MKRILLIFGGVLFLLVAGAATFMFLIHPRAFHASAKEESIRILLSAEDTNQLTQAVGRLGIVLTFPDQSWVAVRYCDSHSGGVVSSAVTRDSGGKWYESMRHFCGSFMNYPDAVMRYRDVNEDLEALGSEERYEMDGFFADVHALACSSNLTQARQQLLAMDFNQLTPEPNKSMVQPH